MKCLFLICWVCCCVGAYGMYSSYRNGKPNLALCLDGKDNNVRTGMGILEPEWTLEAWIRGNDTLWNEMEAIIGGGEYSELNWVDHLPLAVKNGKLYSAGARPHRSRSARRPLAPCVPDLRRETNNPVYGRESGGTGGYGYGHTSRCYRCA